MLLRAVFSPVMMETDHQIEVRSAMKRFGDVVRRGAEGVLWAERTLERRRARSKPAARIGEAGHEVSKPAK